ncbi:MAG: tRNA (guanosine(46)-N7)-methyltransferase TrmB [Deltaproteobacteria bacterium]|nr:tRNA (guanosine(46)-N7)-methyltransferase TrmB [Deltaproteobacteria bacterium]
MPRPPRPYEDVPRLPETGPIALAGLFPGEAPVELEIGFGRGHFLIGRAALLPATRFFGLETRRKWVHVVAERAARAGCANMVVRHADARATLARMEPEGGLARIFVNFPDPWWKTRHEKRMVLTPSFLKDAARLLADGGEIFVQTDVDFRAEAYLGALLSEESLEPLGENGRIDMNPFGARSLRERRCEEVGLPIHRMLFARRSRSGG